MTQEIGGGGYKMTSSNSTCTFKIMMSQIRPKLGGEMEHLVLLLNTYCMYLLLLDSCLNRMTPGSDNKSDSGCAVDGNISGVVSSLQCADENLPADSRKAVIR